MSRSVRRLLLGNGVHAMASTGLAGLANVAVQLVVAGVLSAEDFGRFALASATILFVVGAARMLVGQTDILRGGPGHDPGPVNAAWATAGVALVVGVVVMLLTDPAGGAFTIGLATAASAVFVVQDGARYRAFRQERAWVALVSDVVVLVAAAPGIWVLTRSAGADVAIGVWTAATAVGLVPAVVALRYVPTLPRRRWLHAHRDLVRPGGLEYLLQTGMPYLANWIIVLVAGYADLGGYRLVQLVFAAVSNVAVGLQAATLPRIVAPTTPVADARAALARQRTALLAVSAAGTAVLVLLPPGVGTTLFGATWALTTVFVAPVALHGAVNALSVMNFAVLRHLGRSRFLLSVRTWSVVASSVGVVVGALTLGAVGAAWAMALVAAGAYLVRFAAERRELARWGEGPRATTPGPDGAATGPGTTSAVARPSSRR